MADRTESLPGARKRNGGLSVGSKRKCKLCEQSMRWSLPERVTDKNYEYAKHCLNMAKNTLVCGWTMKTKSIEHDQYCKHYHPKDNRELDFETKCEPKRIKNLEDMIREYENSLHHTTP